jgi:hypothetical protein
VALGDVAVGFSAALAVVFALAILHKARVLVSGQAGAEPLLAQSPWRRRYAGPLLGLAGLVEASAAALLLIEPTSGLVLAGVLLAFYALELRSLPAETTCHCFGSFSATPVRGAAFRNLVFVIGSVAAPVILLAEGGAPSLGPDSLAAAAVVLSGVAAPSALVWTLNAGAQRKISA